VKIGIAGAGVAGSYVYRLLQRRGYKNVDIFDVRHKIACGIHPCGYGVDHNFGPLARLAGLAASDYAVHTPSEILLEGGITAKTTVFMIDKPRLLRDLRDNAPVKYEPIDVPRYDLLVDATGEARSYAPPLRHELMARVVQWRVRVKEPARTAFLATQGVPGYAWIMPLSRDGRDVHLGAGCQVGTGPSAGALTAKAFGGLTVEQVICACGARIRLSGPDFTRIVQDNVWAVGEAAGLVGPASGAGIVYAMRSGWHLVNHLGDRIAYVAALRRDFQHLVHEAKALRRVLTGHLPTPVDVLNIHRGWARIGVHVAWRDMPKAMLTMKRAFGGPVQSGAEHPLGRGRRSPLLSRLGIEADGHAPTHR
jgi:flavin-dependent dehydrogenase